MSESKSQCAVYDFTLSAKFCEDRFILEKNLQLWAKKWCFQKEQGDTGYVHWQGRLSLIKKTRPDTFYGKIKVNEVLKHARFRQTTNENVKNNFYVLKEDTRIDGPWNEEDKARYIPRQVRECPNLRPFQQHIVDSVEDWDTRTINVVYCQSGNNGKSILSSYLRAHNLARVLPMVNDYKDLLRIVCDLPTSRCYVVDMPRAIKKDKIYQLYAALETIKDGYAYDDRYNFKEKVFDCPVIWVFTNAEPEYSLMSRDRWKVWQITADYNLEEYDPLRSSRSSSLI